jgi:hypothetical protein
MIPLKVNRAMSNISFALLVFGVLFLLLLFVSVYVQRPRFGGTSPKAIEVVVFRSFSKETAYRTEITSRSACEKVIKELSQARFAFFGFKPTGVLNIQYDNGKVDRMKFTQCNDGTHSLTFRVFYVMPSRQFCQVLKEAGVDVSKIEGEEI